MCIQLDNHIVDSCMHADSFHFDKYEYLDNQSLVCILVGLELKRISINISVFCFMI